MINMRDWRDPAVCLPTALTFAAADDLEAIQTDYPRHHPRISLRYPSTLLTEHALRTAKLSIEPV